MINVLHQDCRILLHVEYGSILQQQNLKVQVFSLWNHKSQSDLQHLAFWLQQPGVVNRQEVPPSLFMILRHPPVCCVHWWLPAIRVGGGFLPCSVEIQNCRHEESLGHNLHMNLCSTSSRTSFGWSTTRSVLRKLLQLCGLRVQDTRNNKQELYALLKVVFSNTIFPRSMQIDTSKVSV